MSIIASIIIKTIMSKIMDFLKSKYSVICLIIIIITAYIIFLNVLINNKNKKIEKLNNEVYISKLNISNIVLSNNINFSEKKIIISNTFTNSSILIEEIKNENLSEIEINTLNKIIDDYFIANKKYNNIY